MESFEKHLELLVNFFFSNNLFMKVQDILQYTGNLLVLLWHVSVFILLVVFKFILFNGMEISRGISSLYTERSVSACFFKITIFPISFYKANGYR